MRHRQAPFAGEQQRAAASGPLHGHQRLRFAGRPRDHGQHFGAWARATDRGRGCQRWQRVPRRRGGIRSWRPAASRDAAVPTDVRSMRVPCRELAAAAALTAPAPRASTARMRPRSVPMTPRSPKDRAPMIASPPPRCSTNASSIAIWSRDRKSASMLPRTTAAYRKSSSRVRGKPFTSAAVRDAAPCT